MRLLIHAYGASGPIADATEASIKEGCAKHNIEYIRREVPNDLYGRFALLAELGECWYLDSDIKWVDTGINLPDIGNADLAFTKSKNGFWHASLIKISGSKKSSEFLARVIAAKRSDDPWWGSKTITACVGDCKVFEIPRKYNEWSCAVGPKGPPVLVGYHGYPIDIKLREIAK